jgi:hypothetical protein
MPLSYLRAGSHKQAVTHIQESWRFKSMYTLQGKPDQHATHIPLSIRVWFQTIRISHGQRIATFYVVINRVDQGNCSQEKGLPTQSTAWQLTDPRVHTQFLSQDNHWSSGDKANLLYIQHLLAGANPSVLN